MLKQEQPASGFFAHGLLGMHATSGTRLLQGAEATPDTSDSDANKDESSGLQADTIALVMTALLGLGSFLLQAKVSKDADRSQKEIEMAQVCHTVGVYIVPQSLTPLWHTLMQMAPQQAAIDRLPLVHSMPWSKAWRGPGRRSTRSSASCPKFSSIGFATR